MAVIVFFGTFFVNPSDFRVDLFGLNQLNNNNREWKRKKTTTESKYYAIFYCMAFAVCMHRVRIFIELHSFFFLCTVVVFVVVVVAVVGLR